MAISTFRGATNDFFSWPQAGGGGIHRPPKQGPQAEPEPLEPEPLREEQSEEAKTLTLSNPRWLEAKGEFEGIGTACVDAGTPPTAATRVIFKAWATWGERQRKDLPDGEGHIDGQGKAKAAFRLEPPAAGLEACSFHFTAKHSLSEPITGPALEAVPGQDKPFDGVMFYSPSRDEYLMLPAESDLKKLLDEVGRVKALRDKAMNAWALPDTEKRNGQLQDLDEESAALFGGRKIGDSKGGLEELLLVQKNDRWGRAPAWVHIRSHYRNGGKTQVEGHWRKAQDSTVKKQLDRLLSPKAEALKSPFLKSKFKANLFKTEPKAGDLWHWSTIQDADPKKKDEVKRFDFNGEAAMMRYFAGWDGGEASYDWERKKLKLGTAGNASFALFEGQVSAVLELPDNRGLNILGWLAEVKYRNVYLADPKRACMLKFCLKGSLSAFVGSSAYGALSLSGNFEAKAEAGAGAEAGLFMGAQGRGECKGELKWAPAATGPFATLMALRIGAGGSAGLGAEAKLKVEYANGVFRFQMSAHACLGLGLKGDTGFDVGARDAMQLLGHLYDCVDFHFVTEVASGAFEAYRNYSFAVFASEIEMLKDAAERIEWAWHELGKFSEWLRNQGHEIKQMKISILAKSGDRSLMRKSPPEALGMMLRTVMETRETEDFQVIRYILGSTVQSGDGPAAKVSNDHKLKWLLRCVSDIQVPIGSGPEREAKKKAAMEDGIRMIREFGMATGKWQDMDGQESDDKFTRWFHNFLVENGI